MCVSRLCFKFIWYCLFSNKYWLVTDSVFWTSHERIVSNLVNFCISIGFSPLTKERIFRCHDSPASKLIPLFWPYAGVRTDFARWNSKLESASSNLPAYSIDFPVSIDQRVSNSVHWCIQKNPLQEKYSSPAMSKGFKSGGLYFFWNEETKKRAKTATSWLTVTQKKFQNLQIDYTRQK